MPICVTCPHCGSVHPSRVRARSRSHFPEVNAAVGAVQEACPRCGERRETEPGDRFWCDSRSARGTSSPLAPR